MQRNAAGLFALMSLVGSAAMAGPIFLDSSGREWLDVNDTLFHSWNDTAAVCNSSTGSCSGTLTGSGGGIDLSGYSWASRDDVRELFYEVAGLPTGSLDSYSSTTPFGAGYGAQAFSIFDPTIQLHSGPDIENILNGLTRDVFRDTDGALRGISGIIGSQSYGNDSFTLTGGLATDVRESSQGLYLYKVAGTAVPEPATLALFLFGLVGVAAMKKRAVIAQPSAGTGQHLNEACS